MNKTSIIESYLDLKIPNPICELEYNKDYELLIAIVMSAQTTDKRVNSVNKILFKEYPTLEDLSKANINDIEKIIKPIGTYKKKAIFIKEIVSLNKYVWLFAVGLHPFFDQLTFDTFIDICL